MVAGLVSTSECDVGCEAAVDCCGGRAAGRG